jgi:hypothetical protein
MAGNDTKIHATARALRVSRVGAHKVARANAERASGSGTIAAFSAARRQA